MKMFIGSKMVMAEEMNRADYNKFRGWELPADEDGSDEGYLVEYIDGGKPNVSTHAGYVSWSPKAQFDNAHRSVIGMSFGLAIEAMKKGHAVRRVGWNGKGMYIRLTYPNRHSRVTQPYIYMSTVTGSTVPWLASQTDMLADDWEIR